MTIMEITMGEKGGAEVAMMTLIIIGCKETN